MRNTQQQLLRWVEREVRACRTIALRYFRSSRLRVERKADRSPVTQADRMIEERLRRAIHRRLPGESILGEEFGSSDDLGDTYWTIDPIDGTRAFSSGLPSWGIMVGRVERGRATLGVVHYPVFDITLGVAPGVDAYERVGKRQTPLPRARPRHSLQDAVIFHGGLRWWTVPKYVRGFQRIVKASYLERAYGDCYGYLWVLRGYVDAMIDYGVKPWDLVPFAALAQATGRALVDFSGRPSFSGPDTVMAHPTLARLIVKALNHTN